MLNYYSNSYNTTYHASPQIIFSILSVKTQNTFLDKYLYLEVMFGRTAETGPQYGAERSIYQRPSYIYVYDECHQFQPAREGRRERMNVSNVVRWKLCKRNC